jgi:hypothetical protein
MSSVGTAFIGFVAAYSAARCSPFSRFTARYSYSIPLRFRPILTLYEQLLRQYENRTTFAGLSATSSPSRARFALVMILDLAD